MNDDNIYFGNLKLKKINDFEKRIFNLVMPDLNSPLTLLSKKSYLTRQEIKKNKTEDIKIDNVSFTQEKNFPCIPCISIQDKNVNLEEEKELDLLRDKCEKERKKMELTNQLIRER